MAITIDDKLLGQVQALAGLGLEPPTIAKVLGFSKASFYRLKKREPRFAQAYEQGFAQSEVTCSRRLFEHVQKGNLQAIMWFEKTRFGRSEPSKELNLDSALNFLTQLGMIPSAMARELLDVHDDIEVIYHERVSQVFARHVQSPDSEADAA